MSKMDDLVKFEEERIDVANSMIDNGGDFVKALGKALIVADIPNAIKIKHTFDEYWNEYKKFVKDDP